MTLWGVTSRLPSCIRTPETKTVKSFGSSRNQETLNSPLPFLMKGIDLPHDGSGRVQGALGI
jgi:hypothetical protein